MLRQLIYGSVYRRILGGFMTITALIAVISLINFVQLGRVQETTSRAIPESAMLPLIQEYTVVLYRLDAETERFLVIGGVNIQDQILADLEVLKGLEAEIRSIAPPEIQSQAESLNALTLEMDDALTILFDPEEISTRESNQRTLDAFAAIENTSLGLQALLEEITTQLQLTMTSQQDILTTVVTQQLVLTVGVLLGALFGSIILARGIVNPLQNIAETTTQIAQGNYSQRVTVQSSDEIGQLAQSFNNMAGQLEGLIGGLEQRVAERTRDLEIASNVSREVSRVLDMEKLLPYLVETTREGFNLAHVNIYLYDDKTQIVRLAAGSGEVGRKMIEQGTQFHLDDKGLVPLAARTATLQIINDVQSSKDHFANPLLPETRAETTIPMRVGKNVIGILDLQSNEVNYFSEEQLAVLNSLADQIAIAVRNAELFSEAETARESAERSDQVKSSFLASMSHELRTPLNAVINFTKFVAKGDLGPVNDDQVDMLNEVVSSARHLLNLINDVLDMSKIESGALNLFIEENVDLHGILERVISTGKGLIEGKLVEIRTKIPDGLVKIQADRQRVFQVFLNIVSNACKFTDEGYIEVRVSQQDDNVLVAIEDTGAGIVPEDQALVFEAFKQTSTGLRDGGGTGLGMPISKNLVEIHGGKLWLESEKDKGTTFFVSLPIKAEQIDVATP